MAKKKPSKKPANPWATQREASLDGMFSAMRDAASDALGRNDLVIGSKADELQVGLPLPALCLRYLAQCDVFPLGRIWQLIGEEGTCKTALLDEILRWHMCFGGGGCIAETENKDAAELRSSILDYNPRWLNRLTIGPCNSLEEWQHFLTVNVNLARGYMDAAGGPGRTVPMMFGVDSLTSVDSQKEIEKTQKDGFASRGFGTIAMLISRFMRQGMARNFRGYPFSLVGTNHLKPSTDPISGLPTENVPGGKAVPFMATYIISSKRIGDIDLQDYGGVRLRMKMQKNSAGASRKSIEAEFLWWQQPLPSPDERGRTSIQRHGWDWHAASIEFLLKFETTEGKKTLFKQINDIVDLKARRTNKTVTSEALGLIDAPYRAAGAALEARQDLLNRLYPILGINIGVKFIPGMDYRNLEEQARQNAARKTAEEQARAVAAAAEEAPDDPEDAEDLATGDAVETPEPAAAT